MKAIGYQNPLPIENPDSLMDIEIPEPIASGHDLLIKIKAIAVNPVDYKIRQNVGPKDDNYKVIGWDAVGEVVGIGEAVSLFKLGDEVYYAGDLNRQGCNAEYQLVDERIVGFKPKNLSCAEAAALPLTTITAWEILFEHLAITPKSPEAEQKSDEVILVIGSAGGVGSILLQLIKVLTGATIIATASRERSQSWVKKLGAHHVINHNEPLKPQIESLGIAPVTHIAALNNTEAYFETFTEILAPFGKIAMTDDPSEPLNVMKLKPKSQSLHIEFMFTRAMFTTPDMNKQGLLLTRVSKLIDQGYIHTTVGKNLGIINAQNIKSAHQELESGKSIGKIVLENFR